MADTKNALAKLAECLSNDAEYLYGNNDKASEDVSKAQRIVAELANADFAYANDPVSNNCVKLRLDAFIKCRAIAEEGEKMTIGNEDRKLSMCDVCIHNGAKSCKGLAKCNFTRMTDDAQSEEAK